MEIRQWFKDLGEALSLNMAIVSLRAERDRLQEQVVFFKEMVDYYGELEREKKGAK